MHGVLRAVAARPEPSGRFVDAAGAVRLIVPVPGWGRLVDLAFTEIGVYGAGAPQISRKLLAVFDDLSAVVGPERRPAIDAQRTWLRSEVVQRQSLPADQALAPDPLGLG